jgi:23S rRNA (cytidine2498-2'-O)-methyltransferase
MTDAELIRLERPTLLVTCPRGWERQARQELRRLLPGAQVDSLHIAGNIIATPAGELDEALATLAEETTFTLAHVTPVELRVPVGRGRESLRALVEAARLLPAPKPARSFRVACDRRGDHDFSAHEVELALADVFVAGGRPPVDLRHPEQVLSVEIFQDIAFLGMNPATRLLRKPLRRMRIWAPGERPISRAELKLREALERFALELPPDGRALDVGAAPGGWTRELARHVAQVVAVDPADLDPRVVALPGVTHLRVRIEDLDAVEMGRFDVLTNDMNLESLASAGIMVKLAPLLATGGLAVMTIKFSTRRRDRHVREAQAVLSAAYAEIRIATMPHNAKETTAVMHRRP